MGLPECIRVLARSSLLLAVATAASVAAAPGAVQASMLTGSLTSQPIGHYEFCQKNPAECSFRSADPGPAAMSSKLWKQLVNVNLAVNRAVRPMSDMDMHGREEVWSYPVNGVGDCEDYVLEKRERLRSRGIPLSNLLITVVRKPDGEGHAVLTVRTSKGDYILDNLVDSVRPWQKTGYRYLKRQSTEHPGRWVSIRGEQNVLVGAVQ